MNEVLSNIAYIALFIASGLVILGALRHFKMRIAQLCFTVLFCVLLLYIPFYFGRGFALLISDLLFPDSMYASIFVSYTLKRLVVSYAYVRFVSIITSLVALIIAVAAVIVSIVIAFKVVEIVRKYISRRNITLTKPVRAIHPRFVYILNNQHIYKRLLRLLN